MGHHIEVKLLKRCGFCLWYPLNFALHCLEKPDVVPLGVLMERPAW